MKQCVVQVQSQHHLDVIIGRVRSLGGKHVWWWNDSNMYSTYNDWSKYCYMWLFINTKGQLEAHMHNHNCNCKVFMTVQDAIEYLGLDTN